MKNANARLYDEFCHSRVYVCMYVYTQFSYACRNIAPSPPPPWNICGRFNGELPCTADDKTQKLFPLAQRSFSHESRAGLFLFVFLFRYGELSAETNRAIHDADEAKERRRRRRRRWWW